MRTHSWPVGAPALIAGGLALVLFLTWSAFPDAHPSIVLVGFVAETLFVAIGYLIRRRHW